MIGDDEGGAPARITIVPDDYHTRYAGILPDGRQYFASDELLDIDGSARLRGYAAVFLWNSEGEFEEIVVREVARPGGAPPGQPLPAAPETVEEMLDELGGGRLSAISVEPFAEDWNGVVFGLVYSDEDDYERVELHPGNVLAFNPPWDGLEYDT